MNLSRTNMLHIEVQAQVTLGSTKGSARVQVTRGNELKPLYQVNCRERGNTHMCDQPTIAADENDQHILDNDGDTPGDPPVPPEQPDEHVTPAKRPPSLELKGEYILFMSFEAECTTAETAMMHGNNNPQN